MNRIQGSPLLHPQLLDRFQGTPRSSDETRSGQAAGTAGNGETTPADTAEISDTARRMVDLRAAVDAGRAALAALPDTREEKLAEVRARLEQGFYQSTQVREEVAERLGGVFQAMDDL